MSLSKMVQLWSPQVAFVLLVVIPSVSSQLEKVIGEFQFTVPNVTGNFSDAVSWCKTNNSTLAVVNDSYIQTALAQFLKSSNLSSMIYINMKLYKEPISTWFLINGSKYNGGIGNQDTSGRNYLLHCRLRYINSSIVEASYPGDLRNYICDYEESKCSNDSANNIIYKERCYVKYENESLTWFKARERCYNNGGDLAKFQQEPDTNTSPPFNTSRLNTSLTYWVGIRYHGWSWKSLDGGNETIYTSWSEGKPNNINYSCVCVDPNGIPVWSWTDCDCHVQRQFVCLKEVDVQTTTSMTSAPTTNTMDPKTTTVVTGLTVTTNKYSTTTTDIKLAIGLGVGIGGGGLIILIVVIVILVVMIRRRKRKRSSGGSESRAEVESNDEDKVKTQRPKVAQSPGRNGLAMVNKPPGNPVNNEVYAAVVPNGKHPAKKTEPEIVYTVPEFIEDPQSTPPYSNYEVATRVKEPGLIPTPRENSQSLFPQDLSDLYANAKEASHYN